MIFAVEGHIEMIRNGLTYIKPASVLYHPMPLRIVKTETRRLSRGIYQVEAERKKPHKIGYAVQPKRGMPAEPGIRIVMDRIWEEWAGSFLIAKEDKTYPVELLILKENAWAEGGYTPEQFEKVFRKLNPKWNGWSRWAFEFHVVEVRKEVPGITSHAREEKLERSLKHLHQEITEHIHPYVTTKIEKVQI